MAVRDREAISCMRICMMRSVWGRPLTCCQMLRPRGRPDFDEDGNV